MMRPIYLFSKSSHPKALHVDSLAIEYFQPKIDFQNYDGFILTSKQAIEALKYYPKELYIDIPALCISKATAQAYQSLGGNIIAVGGGYGDTLIELIQHHKNIKRWLYLRAEIIASDFVSILHTQGYSIDETIVYKSCCSDAILHVTPPKDAILIFTSPSSIKCFLKNNTIDPSHDVIVIGKTTAKTLPSTIHPFIAPEPTIQSCIDIALSLQ